MFVLLPKMCRSFFLPVLYETSFNLIKQKATKVKNSKYRIAKIVARNSFKNFEIEIKQQKKKKRKLLLFPSL